MPQKPGVAVRSAGSQRDNRWAATVYDQHRSPRFPKGRPFWGYLEYPAERQNDPGFVTELLPGDHNDPMHSSWGAPWMPNQTSDSTGRSTYRLNVRENKVTWLYQTIIADDTAALQRYYDAAAKIAYTKGWDAPGFGQPISFQIHAIMGDPPRSPKIAEAALAGDPWILGFTDQVNPTLAALLNTTRPHDTTTRVVQEVTPLVSPAQVLQPNVDIAAMIAQAIEAHEAAKVAARMAKARSGKKQTVGA